MLQSIVELRINKIYFINPIHNKITQKEFVI